MFPLKGMRYKIRVAPATPEQEYAVKAVQDTLAARDGVLEDKAKIFTTGWLATAEEALELFKEIKKTKDP